MSIIEKIRWSKKDEKYLDFNLKNYVCLIGLYSTKQKQKQLI
jgi:hypothetical protein